MRTRERWILRVAPLLFAVGLALVYLALNDWFGAGDLSALVVWSIPFTLLMGSTVRRLSVRSAGWSRGRQLLLLGSAPAILGFAYVFVVALVLGPWIGAFSFPVAHIWMLAGALTGLLAAALLDRQSRAAAGGVAGVLSVAYLALAFWSNHR